MIVPARIVPPLAFLVALLTVTVLYNVGIAGAPRDFFGARDDIVMILPSTGTVTSTGTVPASLAEILRTRADVQTASPEVVVMTRLRGTSLLARGVEVVPFFDIEGGELVEGSLPEAPGDVLIGRALARRLELPVDARFVLPGSVAATAVSLRISGIFEAPGLANDELVLQLPIAQALAGMGGNGVHLIRVRTTDPVNVTRLASSVTPTFTYSNVQMSSTDLLAGEPASLTARLTNWGVMAGTKEVVVYVDGEPTDRSFVHVPARSTVGLVLPLALASIGYSTVEINPTFNVSVRSPAAEFRDLPSSLVYGRPTRLEVVDLEGSPLGNATVHMGAISESANADGVVDITPRSLGFTRIEIRGTGDALLAARNVFVVFAEDIDRPRPASPSLHVDRLLVGGNDTAVVRVTMVNAGGAAGPVGLDLRVDGAVVAHPQIDLPPGGRGEVQVALGPFSVGVHAVELENVAEAQYVEAVQGDPRIEAALRARELALKNSASAPRVGIEAEEYVARLVRDVTIAAGALTVAAVALATLGVIAVWSRHLAERAAAVGLLKSLGARRSQVQSIATLEAVRYAGIATLAGVLLGISLAVGIDRSEFVRAFGHTISPSLRLYPIIVVAFSSLGVNILLARAMVGSAYRRPADELMGHGGSPARTGAPETLEDVIGGLAR